MDYPKNWIYRILKIYNKVRRIIPHANIMATCPDYPDDYYPRRLWINNEITNIERTLQNVIEYTEKFDYVNWLISIQGWSRQPKSVIKSIKLYHEYGILNEFDYFAIGNLCTELNTTLTCQTIQIVRRELPH